MEVPVAGTHTVVVGVSGGIAAYKAVQVVRSLVLAGHDVHVLPTAAALRFVGLATWEAISRNPVRTDVWDDVSTVAHVDLGRRADVIVVAPATANTLSRLAAGAADDPLTVTALASTAPLVVAPAMHPAMWQHPATQHSMALLRERGATVVGPSDGWRPDGATRPRGGAFDRPRARDYAFQIRPLIAAVTRHRPAT
jgi:phosphopantothenoylcysteine decarboxylase/phosphopantothenate--cysteine ligase